MLIEVGPIPLVCLQWLGVLDVENEEAHSELGCCTRVRMIVYVDSRTTNISHYSAGTSMISLIIPPKVR